MGFPQFITAKGRGLQSANNSMNEWICVSVRVFLVLSLRTGVLCDQFSFNELRRVSIISGRFQINGIWMIFISIDSAWRDLKLRCVLADRTGRNFKKSGCIRRHVTLFEPESLHLRFNTWPHRLGPKRLFIEHFKVYLLKCVSSY